MVGFRHPDLLPRLLQALAWAAGIYGIAYVAWLNRLELYHPAAPQIQVFGFGDANAVAIIGLFALALPLARSWIPLALNSAGLLASLMRGRWVGVAAALAVVAVIRRRIVRVLGPAMAMLLLIAVAILVDFEIPAPTGRSGTISAREVAARLVAVVDPGEAAALGTETMGSANTITWRLDLWRAIWNDIHQSSGKALLGWGHGATLRDVAPFVGEDLRSPHNILLFALAYTGWLGLAVFVMFQLALLGLAWRSYRLTGATFGVACWVLYLVEAQFGNVLETPQGGIPFYLLMGLAVAPVLSRGTIGDAHSSPA
jgi:O-antigen ligase